MSGISDIDRPVEGGNARMGWVSDVGAEMLRRLGIKYVTQNPGSSFGGLHDSIVNYLGNENPTMLLCLNEMAVISIAQGYAKVTGEPMGCIVHSNVGLMNATMCIYNAWVDRVSMLIMGAGGPANADERVPWIHWIHTARDQGALIRHYTKWDDYPGSAKAIAESMLRANILSRTAPKAPVYICFDVALQQRELVEPLALPDMERFAVPEAPEPPAETIERAADLLIGAKSPVIMAGRVSRDQDDWDRRVRLAELLGAEVATDLKVAAAFPTDHPLHVGIPGYHFREPQRAAVENADVVLGLDWLDLGGILGFVHGGGPIKAKVIQCSVDSYVHNGWSMDHFRISPADVPILADPDLAVRRLLGAVEARLKGKKPKWDGKPKSDGYPSFPALSEKSPEATITPADLGVALDAARVGRAVSLARVPLGWAVESYHFRGPLDYLGTDGGAGVGSGLGNAIGSALALMDSDRIPVAVVGDGDFHQGVMALWTAAHYQIPVLVIVCNNRSNLNDEIIQEKIALDRGRPVENRWVGQKIDDPAIDIAALARAQGVDAEGPVASIGALPAALERAFAAVEAGQAFVLDVLVDQKASASTFSEGAGEDEEDS